MNNAIILRDGKEYLHPFEAPCRLSELLAEHPVAHPCGGKGTCQKCRVKASGALSEPTEAERTLDGYRLSCQSYALGDVTITLPDTKIWRKSASAQLLSSVAPIGTHYGYVIDLGTTTVSVALYDQQSGAQCAQIVSQNPQATFGADVLSRLHASIQGKRIALSRCVQDTLSKMCAELLQMLCLKAEDVDAAVLTGNTAMLYLLFGRNPSCIATAPFVCDAVFGDFYSVDFLPMRTGTKLYVPACISAFLGADILTASIASQLWDEDGTHLLADLGTNGEILLQKDGKVWGCSCAAGPAFEGAGLSCGMPAVAGAIDSVKLFGGKLLTTVCENVKPTGICGSGLVELMACLRKNHMLNSDGLLQCGERYLLDSTDVYITQNDVRSFQLSKSAIRTGIDMLMRAADVQTPSFVEIAGTFGEHLNIRSAKEIGLFPNFSDCSFKSIGNAAATGAAMLLLNRDLLSTCSEKASIIQTLSLTQLPYFNDTLLENLSLSQREEK